jgi:hypothetical protein
MPFSFLLIHEMQIQKNMISLRVVVDIVACTVSMRSSTSSIILRISHSFSMLNYGIVNQYNNNETPSFPTNPIFNMS